MSSNIKGYNTAQYEVNAYGDSSAKLTTGMAVKFTRLPIISSPAAANDIYYFCAAAGAGDDVDGVISVANTTDKPISNSGLGRVVLLNAGMFPVLVGADLKKGDPIKPSTGGVWVKATTGDQAYGVLEEDIAKDALGLAKPYRAKI